MNDTSTRPRSGPSDRLIVETASVAGSMAWLSAGIVALLAGVGGSQLEADRSALILSALSLALGLWGFWVHGGRRISAVGIWSFAFALFVGFAGMYTLVTPGRSGPGLVGALAVAYFSQVFMWGWFWSSTSGGPGQGNWRAEPGVVRWGMAVGMIILVASVLLSGRLNEEVNTLVDAAAYVSVLLLSAALLFPTGGAAGLRRLLIPASAFCIYAVFIFSGFGRLTVGTLALGISIFLCKRFRGRSTKALILLLCIPVLIVSARTRVQFTAGLNPDQSPTVSGFESVVVPLEWAGELLVRRDEIPHGWGSTFWASAVSMVPRAMWEGKPEGFGAVLVPILTPELVGTTQSDLALSQAEWLFAFGPIGFVLMVPVLGWFVRMVDRWVATASAGVIGTRRQLLTLVAAAVVASGLADLFWGGTFTFVSRAGPRLLVIGLLLFLSRLTTTKGSMPTPSAT